MCCYVLKRYITRQTIIFVAFAFLLAGCGAVDDRYLPVSTASPEQMDESPFSSSPCKIPCWQGLEVGKSSESDVRTVLPNLKFIEQHTIFVSEVNTPTLDWSNYAPGVEITASCIKSKKKCLEIIISDDILTEINITLDYVIRADEAIAYLGDPSYVGTSPETVHRGMACVIFFVWSDSKVLLSSTLHGKSGEQLHDCSVVHHTGKVSKELVIMEVSYLSDAALQGRLPDTKDIFEFSGFAPD